MKRRIQNMLRSAVTPQGKPSKSLMHPKKSPLFSGAEPHPVKNLGHYAHPKKKR